MTALHRLSSAAVVAWCRRQGMKLLCAPRHVHPRTYIIGSVAPGCIIVAAPWFDSEPHLRDWDRDSPLATVRKFDASLKAGDWCITAYVCRSGSQEHVAVPIPRLLLSHAAGKKKTQK